MISRRKTRAKLPMGPPRRTNADSGALLPLPPTRTCPQSFDGDRKRGAVVSTATYAPVLRTTSDVRYATCTDGVNGEGTILYSTLLHIRPRSHERILPLKQVPPLRVWGSHQGAGDGMSGFSFWRPILSLAGPAGPAGRSGMSLSTPGMCVVFSHPAKRERV